uniref:Ricin B lectin domain-containing protein n=1 Tax=Psilocybe cubensis TaxID=181762 RepID=A0A8H7XN36_PSICU
MPANVQSGNRYVLVNKKGKTVVDLSGTDGRSVIGWERHNGENQQWEVIEVNGGWNLKNVGTGKYLSLGCGIKNGGSVVGSDEPFTWQITQDSEDCNGLRVKVPNTNKDLDLSDNGNPTPGNPIEIWGSWKADNQIWYFEQAC